LRLSLRGTLVRHRGSDAAARGGQSAAAARGPARARVVQPRLIRHALATRRGLASEDARPRPAAALRRMWLRRETALRRLPRRAPADRAAALRALRRPDRVAGRTLPRVRGPQARLRERPGGGRVRRGSPPARPRLEGARSAAPRRRGRTAGGRAPPAARGRGAHVRPGRPLAAPRAWAQPGGAARARAGRALGAAVPVVARADARWPPARQLGHRTAHGARR